MRSVFRNLTAALLAFSIAVLAQAPPRAVLNFDAIARPRIPIDPLELVTSVALPVQNAQERIDAVTLLTRAHDLSNVRAQPYDLKTSFTSSGGLASDGSWVLEDMARGTKYRWSAQGPNYSGINLYPESTQGALYGNQPGGILPLRLLQVRSAIFFVYPTVGPYASVRTATGSLNGVEQRCVLVVIGAGNRSFTGGRNWEESEYCVDAQSGLLTTYSPAPGLYVRYDYSSATRFHNKTIPTGFTITEAGQTVAEAKTIGVTDPPEATDGVFNPAGLTPLGVGPAMNSGSNIRTTMPAPGRRFPASNGSAEVQVVVLHGNVAGDGRLSEVEILASSQATLNQAAIERANSLSQARVQGQPGATAQSRELLLTFEFISKN